MSNPFSTNHTTDVGSHQTMEANRSQPIPVKNPSSWLMGLLAAALLLALIVCWCLKTDYERSGTLQLQGQTQGCQAEVRCSRLNPLLNFPWLNGDLTITPDDGSQALRYEFRGFSSRPEPGLRQVQVCRSDPRSGVTYRGFLYFSEDLQDLVLYSPQEDVVYYCSSMTFRNLVTEYIATLPEELS